MLSGTDGNLYYVLLFMPWSASSLTASHQYGNPGTPIPVLATWTVSKIKLYVWQLGKKFQLHSKPSILNPGSKVTTSKANIWSLEPGENVSVLLLTIQNQIALQNNIRQSIAILSHLCCKTIELSSDTNLGKKSVCLLDAGPFMNFITFLNFPLNGQKLVLIRVGGGEGAALKCSKSYENAL